MLLFPSISDSCNCMNYVSYWGGRNHFVFVGDSRIRQLYLEVVGLFGKESIKSSKYHGKLSFSDAKTNVLVVRLTFHNNNGVDVSVRLHYNAWFLFLIFKLLKEFFWAPFVDNSMREILDFWTRSDSSPRLVVIGSALVN